MKISDFKGIFRTSVGKVVSVENPFDDYYIINLKAEDNLQWRPGEHAIFSIPDKEIRGKKWRAFSIASTSDEKIITIGTRTGKEPSAYKTQLISLGIHDTIKIRGPFGWFTKQNSVSPIVFAAGGVGITPIFAMLKSLNNDSKMPVTLLYSSKGQYLFESEIKQIISSNKNMTLYSLSSYKDTAEQLAEKADRYSNDAFYYLSGSTGFIKSNQKLLKKCGIKSKKIINDPFLGY